MRPVACARAILLSGAPVAALERLSLFQANTESSCAAALAKRPALFCQHPAALSKRWDVSAALVAAPISTHYYSGLFFNRAVVKAAVKEQKICGR